MSRLYLLIMIFVGFTLSGCALMSSSDPQPQAKVTPAPVTTSQKTKKVAINQNKPKNPLAVQVYPKGTRLAHPYTVLAQESVSIINSAGIKRQEANIHDALRSLAASIGGDAVINVKHDTKEVTGTIVSFEQGNLG